MVLRQTGVEPINILKMDNMKQGSFRACGHCRRAAYLIWKDGIV